MPDPFMGWLSYVDQLLAVLASIAIHLAKISGSLAIVLGTVLGMWLRVQRFRRDQKVTPAKRRKPTVGHRLKKRGCKGSSAST